MKTHALAVTMFMIFLFDGNLVFAQTKADSTAKPAKPDIIYIEKKERSDPLITIGKHTLYGFSTAWLLYFALARAIGDDADLEGLGKWILVGGTVGGFIWGIHRASQDSKAESALFQFHRTHLAKVTFPKPRVHLKQRLAISVDVISWSL